MQTLLRSIGTGLIALAAVGVACAQETPDTGTGAAKAKAEIGKAAPDFELKDSTGKAHKLSEYKDKIVVLEWWNKDCPYCVKAMPQMKALHEKYGKQGVIWLAIDSTHNHSPSDVQKAVADEKIGYPVLMDTDGKVGHAYGAKTTPHMFIINKGTLAYAGAHDEKEGKRDYIAEAVDALLAGKTVPLAETKPYGCSVKYKK